MRKGLLGSAIVVAVLSGCGGTGPAGVSGTEFPKHQVESSGLVPLVGSPLPARRQPIVLTGRIVDLNDPEGIWGVSVKLGRAAYCVGVSDAGGAFTIALPVGATVASLLCNSARTFSVAVPSSSPCSVVYEGRLHPADSVPLPADVVQGRRADLGTISIVVPLSAGDGDVPPPPPSFAE